MRWSLRDWVYIAVLGALWGAVEIGLGSYLHLIFPPLANTFFNGLTLAFIGITVVLTGRSFVPRPGAVLMIGVIAALLKLTSPGGVKLGPAIAILAEAALMEVGLRLRGGQAVGSYMLAGGLAIGWNAVHPLLMLPLLMGRSVSQAYAKVAQDGAAILGLDARMAGLILAIMFVIRWSVGALAGGVAWRLGSAVRARLRADVRV